MLRQNLMLSNDAKVIKNYIQPGVEVISYTKLQCTGNDLETPSKIRHFPMTYKIAINKFKGSLKYGCLTNQS